MVGAIVPEMWEEGSAICVGLGDYEASRLGVRSNVLNLSVCGSWEQPRSMCIHRDRRIILVENGMKVRDSLVHAAPGEGELPVFVLPVGSD